MEYDFSAYTVESLEEVLVDLKRDWSNYNYAKELGEASEHNQECARLVYDLISMLTEAKTKSLAFRKGMEGKIDKVRLDITHS